MSGRTSLTRFAGQMREPDPTGIYRAKKEAWHDHGLLVVDPKNDLCWDGTYELENTLTNLGNRLYGKRKKR